jgi:hypothetical protein
MTLRTGRIFSLVYHHHWTAKKVHFALDLTSIWKLQHVWNFTKIQSLSFLEMRGFFRYQMMKGWNILAGPMYNFTILEYSLINRKIENRLNGAHLFWYYMYHFLFFGRKKSFCFFSIYCAVFFTVWIARTTTRGCVSRFQKFRKLVAVEVAWLDLESSEFRPCAILNFSWRLSVL